ncbi:hypothetical protein ACFQJ8_19395 [Halocatena marina]|uniref:hypothetical protein n=1 Tax=Halocatena marina TaxID=2934937 RepID=UPI00361B716C
MDTTRVRRQSKQPVSGPYPEIEASTVGILWPPTPPSSTAIHCVFRFLALSFTVENKSEPTLPTTIARSPKCWGCGMNRYLVIGVRERCLNGIDGRS